MSRLRTILPVLLLLLLAWGPEAHSTDVAHHDLSVSVDPESRIVSVRDTLRVTGGGAIHFALNPAFRIGWASVDGAPAEVAGRDGLWAVDLGAEGGHELILSYRGRASPMAEAARGGGLLAGPDGVLLAPGSGWVPLFDGRTPFTYRIEVDVPRPFKAVTAGRLLREDDGAGRYVATFDFPHPTDGVALFAGRWTIRERMRGDLRLRTYFDAGNADLSESFLDAAGRYIDLYAERIGAYPFSAFHVVSGRLQVGWGFPGLTYIGSRVLPLPYVLDRSLGHEILHNWWGNGVYIDYASGNWAEGLTTYLADHYLAARRDPAAARDMRLQWLRDHAALPPERETPLTGFRSKTHGAAQVVGYGKSAMLFHMLRAEIGDAAFDDGLRRFWTGHRFSVAGWRDLRAAFEASSGRDLEGFFDQWTRRRGAPTLTLDGARAEGRRLRLSVSADGGYALRVPVRIATATGLRDDILDLRDGVAEAAVDLDSPPRSVTVDPDFDLFRRLDPAETPPILRDVMLSGTAVLAVPGDDGETGAVAERLAAAMLERPVERASDDAVAGNRPWLVISADPEALDAYLRAHVLPGPPPDIAARGTARVWAARTPAGRPLAVVAADDGAALAALLRPLPHYGRRGHLAFDGARAVVKGVARAARGPLHRTFAPPSR